MTKFIQCDEFAPHNKAIMGKLTKEMPACVFLLEESPCEINK